MINPWQQHWGIILFKCDVISSLDGLLCWLQYLEAVHDCSFVNMHELGCYMAANCSFLGHSKARSLDKQPKLLIESLLADFRRLIDWFGDLMSLTTQPTA